MGSSFLAIGAGLLVPALDIAEYSNPGFGSSLAFGFSSQISSGHLGLALLSGLSRGEVRESLSSSYALYSIPLGALAYYELESSSAFRIFFEVGGGESVNFLSFTNGNTAMIFTPFVLGGVGGEISIRPKMAVGISARCALLFFSNIVYMNVTPTVFLKTYFLKE
jgi:hypothetical protein